MAATTKAPRLGSSQRLMLEILRDGSPPNRAFTIPEINKLWERLIEMGLAEWAGGRVALTPAGVVAVGGAS